MELGRYQLSRLIGQGGMAEVWHARLTGLGRFEREVAIKLLLPHYASDAEFSDMLLDEARIAACITHSNVVQMLDVGQEAERFFLVMEYVEGTDLRGLLRRSRVGRLPLEHALYAVSEVAKGLEAVHTAKVRGIPRRIIHRDISPSNILISGSGEVKLADFGIARAAERLTRTRAGSVKGQTRYMSPEQLGGGRLDGRSDLYSLTIVLAEVLVGPSIFSRNGDGAPGRGRILAEATRVALPDDVIALLRVGLASKPDNRPVDAAEFGRACADLLHRRTPGYDERSMAAFVVKGDARVVDLGQPSEDITIRAHHLAESQTRDNRGSGARHLLERLAPGTELVPVRNMPALGRV
jgi:serine/threonine-protein kinase